MESEAITEDPKVLQVWDLIAFRKIQPVGVPAGRTAQEFGLTNHLIIFTKALPLGAIYGYFDRLKPN